MRANWTYRVAIAFVVALAIAASFAFQTPRTADRVADAFASGWMLADTNGDGIDDFINGKVVVPANPSASENAAAADFAARLGYGSTGLTPPLVVNSPAATGNGPWIWVGKDSVPASSAAELTAMSSRLEKEEGGVFAIGGNLAVVGFDNEGLLAAAEAYASRAPYLWRTPGDKLSVISQAVSNAELIGVTYLRGKAGVHRAFLRSRDAITVDKLTAALSLPRLAAVHQLIVVGGIAPVSAENSKPEAAQPPAVPQPAGPAAGP